MKPNFAFAAFLAAVTLLAGVENVDGQHLSDNGALALLHKHEIVQDDSLEILRTVNGYINQYDPADGAPAISAPVAGSESAPDHAGQVAEIQKRIDLLKRIYKRREEAKVAEDADDSSTEPDLRGTATHLTGTSGSAASDSVEVDPQTLQHMLPPSSSVALTGNPGTTIVIGRDCGLPERVNIFEMGNSLFLTGNTELALRAYESVDRRKVTAFDSIWLEFMIATCKRKMGQTDEAQAIYRDIASEKSSGHPAEEAIWWLKHLERTAAARQTVETLESELDTLIERAQSYVIE